MVLYLESLLCCKNMNNESWGQWHVSSLTCLWCMNIISSGKLAASGDLLKMEICFKHTSENISMVCGAFSLLHFHLQLAHSGSVSWSNISHLHFHKGKSALKHWCLAVLIHYQNATGLIMPWCCCIIYHWNMCAVKVFLQGLWISREDFCLPNAKQFYILQEYLLFFFFSFIF